MKCTMLLAALVLPFVLAGPAQPVRYEDPSEWLPNNKRFIPMETADGKIELVDLIPENIEPLAVAVSDVSYDFYSKSTQSAPVTITNNNVNTLDSTTFSKSKTTLFVIHGWNNNRNSDVNTNIRKAAFINNDFNLFIVDWSGPANKDYFTSKAATVEVGKIVGAFITSIQTKYGIDGSNFILTGHSLGAHTAGCAGAAAGKQIEHIIGLDPAGPLYSLSDTASRLDATDAKFVQILHTNGALLGMSSSCGDIDYYPNGGKSQPGCGLDLIGTCAHSRAYLYFAESLSRGDVFLSRLCSSYTDYTKGSCNSNTASNMGSVFPAQKSSGDYFLTTNSATPFAN